MIKTILEGNKQLIEAHKDKREIETMKEPEEAKAQTVNNNVFVGSTTELHKLLKQLKSQ
jgi:peptidoglycan hydrolase CwlO-like protein